MQVKWRGLPSIDSFDWELIEVAFSIGIWQTPISKFLRFGSVDCFNGLFKENKYPFFSWFCWLFLCFSLGWGFSGSRKNSPKFRLNTEEGFDLLRMWEGVLILHRQRQDLPVSIEDRVWYWGNYQINLKTLATFQIPDRKWCRVRHVMPITFRL